MAASRSCGRGWQRLLPDKAQGCIPGMGQGSLAFQGASGPFPECLLCRARWRPFQEQAIDRISLEAALDPPGQRRLIERLDFVRS